MTREYVSHLMYLNMIWTSTDLGVMGLQITKEIR